MAFQLGASLLDACVLSVLEEEDAYGYIITQKVQLVLEVSETALYPVLRRLQKEGCLETYEKSFQGRNRRYYTITPAGKEVLYNNVKMWDDYKTKIDTILHRGKADE